MNAAETDASSADDQSSGNVITIVIIIILRSEINLGGTVALLLQDQRTMLQ